MLTSTVLVLDMCLQRQIEGEIVENSSCLIVEDVVTSGTSVLETCTDLRRVGLKVVHAVVLLDREQGGRRNVEKEGVALHSVFTITQLMHYLLEAGKITTSTVDMVKTFIRENNQVKVAEKPNPAVSVYVVLQCFKLSLDYIVYCSFPTCCQSSGKETACSNGL